MTEKQNIENWMSMSSITEYLDVSRETVLQWINNRNMPAHKVGRLWKFKASEVDEWIRSGGAAESNSETVTDDAPAKDGRKEGTTK